MNEEQPAGTAPGSALSGLTPDTPTIPPTPSDSIDRPPPPDPITPPSGVPHPRGYILDQLHSRDVAEAMLINALIKSGWPRDRAPDRAVALITRDPEAKDRFAESDWKGFERTIDGALGNLQMSPRQWREIQKMYSGWKGTGTDAGDVVAPFRKDESGLSAVPSLEARETPGANRLASASSGPSLPQGEGAGSAQPRQESTAKSARKKSAVIVDTPDGPYLMVDPQSKDTPLIEGPTAHRISSEADKKAFGLYLPPSAADVSGLDEGLPTDKGRAKMPREGQPLVIRYPNGESLVARNPKTGETLKVGGSTMHVMDAADAERKGLGDWMPFTEPKATIGPIVPDLPNLPPGASKRQKIIEAFKSVIKTGAENIDSVLPYLLEDRARELYSPNPVSPDAPKNQR